VFAEVLALIFGSTMYGAALVAIHSSLRVSSSKNENSVSIYTPSCCSKPLCVSLYCYTQRNIFGRMF